MSGPPTDRFDLDIAIRTWRHQFRTSRSIRDVELDELERHLRDHVRFLTDHGMDVESAFRTGVSELGSQFDLESGFEHEPWARARSEGRTGSEIRARLSLLASFIRSSARALVRDPVPATINVAGLAAGIAAAVIIMLFIRHERAYDRFIPDADRIYRVAVNRVYPDNEIDFATASVMLAPTLEESSPDVEAATRVHRMFFQPTLTVRAGDRFFTERRFYFADSNFFQVFDHTVLRGDAATALNTTDQVVLTRETAERVFGDIDVVGQSLFAGDDELFVSAVVENRTGPSHMNFDYLRSIRSLPYLISSIDDEVWTAMWVYTYVKLRPGVDAGVFEGSIPDLVDPVSRDLIASRLGVKPDALAKSGHAIDYFLQPLMDIHLDASLAVELEPGGSRKALLILVIVVGFILLVSAINFVNLATARAGIRAREIGLRKTLGSSRSELIRQLLVESLLTASIAAVLSFAVAAAGIGLVSPLVDGAVGRQDLFAPFTAGAMVVFAILCGLLAGAYPAIAISRLDPVDAVKGHLGTGAGAARLRKGLLYLQFAVSIVLITSTLIVRSQLSYMAEKNMGFDDNGLLVVEQTGQLGAQYDAFRRRVQNLPGIESAGGADTLPGDLVGSTFFSVDGTEGESFPLSILTADAHFFRTLGVEVDDGSMFPEVEYDSLSVLLNRTAVAALGLDDPVGAVLLQANGLRREVRGVIPDFHYHSFHDELAPLVVETGGPDFQPGSILVKIDSNDASAAVTDVESVWADFVDRLPFRYTFLEDKMDATYSAERRTFALGRMFAALAVILSLAGLFGMASFTARMRMKEISIRKVLGARTASLVALLGREYTALVLLAGATAMPIAWIAADRWLEDFAYRISVSPWLFVWTGAGMVLIAWVTISIHVLRTAVANPAAVLRQD
jgi:putative ABC transport system permease protein